MKRYFNTEGSCNPEQHYMVRLDDRLNHIKELLVDRKKYFYGAWIYGRSDCIWRSEKVDTMTMTNLYFLKYWLYAAFPHCHGLWKYLLKEFPCPQEHSKEQGALPMSRTITVGDQSITILLYQHHVEYRTEERELYQPCLPYHVVENLDNDTYFLLLPVVDMAECGYSYTKVMPDFVRRLSETALPEEHIEEVAYRLSVGLAEADGAEDEPLWVIWQERAGNLYGAEWWPDAGELHLFQQYTDGSEDMDDGDLPDDYVPAPEGVDIYLWAKSTLEQWIR